MAVWVQLLCIVFGSWGIQIHVFEHWSSQTNGQWLRHLYLSLHSQVFSITKIGQGLTVRIMWLTGISGHGTGGHVPPEQYYKVTKIGQCPKLVPILMGPGMLPRCKTPKTNQKYLYSLCVPEIDMGRGGWIDRAQDAEDQEFESQLSQANDL